MRLSLIAILVCLLASPALASGKYGSRLAPWSAGSMPPIGGFGRTNYYGAGGLQYGHPANRIYGATPPLYGWVLVRDGWGNTYYQWQQVTNVCR